eukprot:gene8009-8869_t
MFSLFKIAAESIYSRVNDGKKAEQQEELSCEEKVLVCKNNVCINLPNSSKHIPGYFSLKSIQKAKNESDILLYWVPNSLLAIGLVAAEDVFQEQDEKGEEEISCVSNNALLCSINNLNINADDCDESVKSNCSLSDENVQDDGLATRKQEDQTPPSSPSKLNDSFSTPYGGVFNLNLAEMKALKIFYTDQQFTIGQLVVCNLENQYKVFHFHHSGIANVANVFAEWRGCKENAEENYSETMQRTFIIKREMKILSKNKISKIEPTVESHPEDGNISPVNSTFWKQLLNSMGQIEDVNSFRKSTSFERDKMKLEKEIEYHSIQEKRLGLKDEKYEEFWKNIQLTVDKDVVRTDRSHPYFSGEQNPNIEKMRNILLNYAIYNPDIGYTQGMSDLLSPILAMMEDEVDSFWSFVGLMQFSLFTTTPKDHSMEKSLGFLRELLRIIYPDFYIYCLMQDEDLSLLFCHRWLVLCFKREFIQHEILRLWEACWSRYQTDYFHIFISVAMICLYGEKCIKNNMKMDEMMQYFMNMAMQFDGQLVLQEARSLLYKFRKMQVIPCTLEELLSDFGAWDGGIRPDVECISRHRKCCFKN